MVDLVLPLNRSVLRMPSNPHKIVVRVWLSQAARFADVWWNVETSSILRQCHKEQGVYSVHKPHEHEIMLKYEIK
jgi:hypothetical protein